jgi:hypothetical protein
MLSHGCYNSNAFVLWSGHTYHRTRRGLVQIGVVNVVEFKIAIEIKIKHASTLPPIASAKRNVNEKKRRNQV